MEKQLLKYKEAFDENDLVITIAHSQGNFYTRYALDDLIKKNPDYEGRYRIISVGSPITIPEASGYLKDSRDPVTILAISSKANVENSNLSDDSALNHHSYISYIFGNDSRPKFKKLMTDVLQSFKDQKEYTSTNELIRIEMEKSSPDVNMYIHEFLNARVFFKNNPKDPSFGFFTLPANKGNYLSNAPDCMLKILL